MKYAESFDSVSSGPCSAIRKIYIGDNSWSNICSIHVRVSVLIVRILSNSLQEFIPRKTAAILASLTAHNDFNNWSQFCPENLQELFQLFNILKYLTLNQEN